MAESVACTSGVCSVALDGVLTRLREDDPVLQKVDFSHWLLVPEAVVRLSEALRSNTALATLHLGRVAAGAPLADLAAALQAHGGLEHLVVGGGLVEQFGPALAPLLQGLATLTVVDSPDALTASGAAALAASIRGSGLRALNLRTRESGLQAAPIGFDVVRAALREVSTLDLGRAALGWLCPRELAATVADSLASSPVTAISLAHSRVDDEGVAALAGALQANTTLQKLDLRGTAVTAAGARSLAEVLQQNTTLTELHLPDVEGAESEAVAAVLERNRRLPGLWRSLSWAVRKGSCTQRAADVLEPEGLRRAAFRFLLPPAKRPRVAPEAPAETRSVL